MFAGVANFAPHCRACKLDYSAFNVGDGPAAFLTLIVGGVVMALALWVEFSFAPPWWLHAMLWLPLLIVLVIGGLRLGKAALLVREYTARAEEHRHE